MPRFGCGDCLARGRWLHEVCGVNGGASFASLWVFCRCMTGFCVAKVSFVVGLLESLVFALPTVLTPFPLLPSVNEQQANGIIKTLSPGSSPTESPTEPPTEAPTLGTSSRPHRQNRCIPHGNRSMQSEYICIFCRIAVTAADLLYSFLFLLPCFLPSFLPSFQPNHHALMMTSAFLIRCFFAAGQKSAQSKLSFAQVRQIVTLAAPAMSSVAVLCPAGHAQQLVS